MLLAVDPRTVDVCCSRTRDDAIILDDQASSKVLGAGANPSSPLPLCHCLFYTWSSLSPQQGVRRICYRMWWLWHFMKTIYLSIWIHRPFFVFFSIVFNHGKPFLFVPKNHNGIIDLVRFCLLAGILKYASSKTFSTVRLYLYAGGNVLLDLSRWAF